MVERSVLIQEIDSLPPRFYGDVINFITNIKKKKPRKQLSLEKAAEMAAEEYRSNKELTVFCSIDGDDFYETR